jgi:hypothetical protein
MVRKFLEYGDEILQIEGNSMGLKVDSNPMFVIHISLKWVYSDTTLEAKTELVGRVIFQLHHS